MFKGISDRDMWTLWKRGEAIHVTLAEHQKPIDRLFEKKLDTVFGAELARQTGKTFWACAKADEIARKFPGCQIRIGTAFQDDLEPIIMASFTNVLATCPEELKPKYRPATGEYIYADHLYGSNRQSRIRLVGIDKNPNKMRGNRVRLFILEEAGFIDSDKLKYTIDSVCVPAQTHEPEGRIILISTPPEEGQDHSFCEIVDSAALKGSYIKMTIDQNSMLSKERIEEIAASYGGRDSIAFRREYLCERIVDDTKVVIPDFDEKRHVQEFQRPDYFEYLHKYAGLDTGVRDFTHAEQGFYDFPKARLFIEDEFVLKNHEVTTPNIFGKTKEVEIRLGYSKELTDGKLERTKNFVRYSDNNNLILIQDLNLLGAPYNPTTKDSLDAMINKLRVWFKQDRIIIHPRCKFLIGTVRSALWNKNRDDFKRTKAFGHADALASLMYLVRNVDELSNPIPREYGRDMSHTWFLKPAMPSENAQKIARAFKLKTRTK